jgi:pimeloyl-ACP methyl ester carboxylesterase
VLARFSESALPRGIRSRLVPGINGLTVHLLEAGFQTPGRPLVLLIHGFPELAYSWRKVLLPLAEAGFHLVAFDQRGYGRTTGWVADFDDDFAPYRTLNLVRDALGLVSALGHRRASVVGHDVGSVVAAWCALIRPDVFGAVALMSAPFSAPPALPFDTHATAPPASGSRDIDAELATLNPPRKHYQRYLATRDAESDMMGCPQGLHDFLRAYYHVKSADWPANKPFPLANSSATELAKLPAYYVMERDQGMAETVADHMPSQAEITACGWLPDHELRFYSTEFARTGLQGALQWYRSVTSSRFTSEMELFSGRSIDVPSCFIAGARDWGSYQQPGALETMQGVGCTDMRMLQFVEGAGHWVQQEQPDEVNGLLLQFLATNGTRS